MAFDAKEILASVIGLVISLIVVVAVFIQQIEAALFASTFSGNSTVSSTCKIGGKCTIWNFTGSQGAIVLVGLLALVVVAGLAYRFFSEWL